MWAGEAVASWPLNERKCIRWGFLCRWTCRGDSEPGPVQVSQPVCVWPRSRYILNEKKLEATEVLLGRIQKTEPCLQSKRYQALSVPPSVWLSPAVVFLAVCIWRETSGAFPRLRTLASRAPQPGAPTALAAPEAAGASAGGSSRWHHWIPMRWGGLL